MAALITFSGGSDVLVAEEAEDDFSARFSARSRAYRYLILRRAVRSPFEARRALYRILADHPGDDGEVDVLEEDVHQDGVHEEDPGDEEER